MLQITLRCSWLLRAAYGLLLLAAGFASMRLSAVLALDLYSISFFACSYLLLAFVLLYRVCGGETMITFGKEFCLLEHRGSAQRTELPRVLFGSEWLLVLKLRQHASCHRRSLHSLLAATRYRTVLITPGSCSKHQLWQLRCYLQTMALTT